MIISELLSEATGLLESSSDSARLDAEILLCHLLQKDRAYLITWPDKELDSQTAESFQQLVQRRQTGEPVAYIIGQKEFWSLNLNVNPHTLIPRPETELLVEYILQHYPADRDIKLADLGTGSGAIALALASERSQWQIIATDQSNEAIKTAEHNAAQLKLNNIEFRQGSWFQPLADEAFDIIVSNPPYVAEHDEHLTQGDVRFEPQSALASGADGLNDIRLIADQARQHLHADGLLIIEHGYDQKDKIFDIFNSLGYKKILQLADIAKKPRVTLGYSPI
ncbi:MAG: peptide chain release factor N(5)-glutamine methyltransferase [Gammaproteobacteria bacterium]|nr:peptide chain release factor N(5)-glutamine methyltransferase [Gammaproteobacteria bacterium]MCW8910272.1 peptide chain release factor N(5)-glutamine methyltransferase [Gammaproteobacteria bacterium]MCW9005058.1 peptide chain release factor N(5)-glutamine methyltransferase [Gammaproteobacteria bacterium]MCW9055399.1 peptide chain release factor N(5)-glutamine methyltransferase [Gammaproteobacteria bacterium]